MKVHGQLMVFTRFPEPGRTKPRLSPHLGAEEVARLLREMTEHTEWHKTRLTPTVAKLMKKWLGFQRR